MYTADSVKSYKSTEVRTSNRLDVLIMLYDGAIRFMNQAKDNISKNDNAKKGTFLSKATAIINEFKNTLCYDYDPKLATDLERLYNFIQERLLQANIENEIKHVEDALKVTNILRDAWIQLRDQQNGLDNSEAKESFSENYFRISV